MELINADSSSFTISVFHKYVEKQVFTGDILFARGSGSYTLLQTVQGAYILSTNLGKLCEKLNPKQFLRVHKSYVVNLHRIDLLAKTTVVLAGHTVPTSNEGNQELRRQLRVIPSK